MYVQVIEGGDGEESMSYARPHVLAVPLPARSSQPVE